MRLLVNLLLVALTHLTSAAVPVDHQVPLLHDNLHLELPRLLMPSLQVQPVVEEVMLAWMESVEAEA